jgi:hypothetical protein
VSPQERSEERALVERLRRDARSLAVRFGLVLRSLDAENARVKRRYGICFEDGAIRIRLRHARTGRLLKYSFLIDTLCHELAHLRYFDHGARFKAFYLRILEHARRDGIYRPTPRPLLGIGAAPIQSALVPTPLSMGETRCPRAPVAPVQLELF